MLRSKANVGDQWLQLRQLADDLGPLKARQTIQKPQAAKDGSVHIELRLSGGPYAAVRSNEHGGRSDAGRELGS